MKGWGFFRRAKEEEHAFSIKYLVFDRNKLLQINNHNCIMGIEDYKKCNLWFPKITFIVQNSLK